MTTVGRETRRDLEPLAPSPPARLRADRKQGTRGEHIRLNDIDEVAMNEADAALRAASASTARPLVGEWSANGKQEPRRVAGTKATGNN